MPTQIILLPKVQGYFSNSQKIKKELEQDEWFMRRLQVHLTDRKAHELGSGTNNTAYTLGQSRGLWVAVREHRLGNSDLLEYYAQEAERLSRDGKRVPAFCIGVEYQHKRVLLVEDVSQGKSREVHMPSGSITAVVDGILEPVYLDLDNDFSQMLRPRTKYFGRDARLHLAEVCQV